MARNLTALTLFAALIAATCCPAAAEQTLTLTLEAPSLSSSGAGQTAAQKSSQAKSSSHIAQTARRDGVTVGRVGMVCVPTAGIYQSRSSSSRRYATVKQETPLAIVKEDAQWMGVLMTNGSVGWIPASSVRFTGYELVADKDALDRGALASRGGQPDRAAALALGGANDLIRTAMGYSGVRYVFGGTNPETGMDCSAFVQAVFARHGVRLPRTSREQANVGQSVPFDQLRPGDRLYFACRNPHIDHCGIYVGDGYFIHCSSGRNGVGLDTLASDFYWRSLVTARR